MRRPRAIGMPWGAHVRQRNRTRIMHFAASTQGPWPARVLCVSRELTHAGLQG